MDQPLVTFASRRLRAILATVFLTALVVGGLQAYELSLRDMNFASGWLLIGSVAVLGLFSLRKKLPFLPLISASAWLQLHVYLGFVTVVVFALHTSFRLPTGALETLLWSLFVAVSVSGVIGIVLNRVLPRRLRQHGERIIFERIPVLRAEIGDEVRELATRSISETGSNTIAQYYATHLHSFLRRPRNFIAHIAESHRPAARIRRDVRSLERYLTPAGRRLLQEIESRVLAKNELDYQHALHLLLKGWLFIHVPLTYCLFLVIAVHAVLAYAFTDGAL